MYVYIYTVCVKTGLNWDLLSVALWEIVFSKGPRPINLIYVKIQECAQVTPQLLFLKARELKETGICLFSPLLNVPVHLFIPPLISFPLYVCFFHHCILMISLQLILCLCVCVRACGSIRDICRRPVFIRRPAAQACVQLSQEMPPHGILGLKSKASNPSQVLHKESHYMLKKTHLIGYLQISLGLTARSS